MLTKDPGPNSRDVYGLMNPADIRKAIIHACMANRCLEMARNIKIEYSNRYVAKFGTANLNANRIVLSAKLFRRIKPAMQRETVIHEVCHLIAFAKHGERKHGDAWKNCMRAAGLRPEVTGKTDIPTSDLRRKGAMSPYRFACSCNRNFEVSHPVGERIRVGSLYRCRKCKGRIMIIPASLKH